LKKEGIAGGKKIKKTKKNRETFKRRGIQRIDATTEKPDLWRQKGGVGKKRPHPKRGKRLASQKKGKGGGSILNNTGQIPKRTGEYHIFYEKTTGIGRGGADPLGMGMRQEQKRNSSIRHEDRSIFKGGGDRGDDQDCAQKREASGKEKRGQRFRMGAEEAQIILVEGAGQREKGKSGDKG